MTTTQPKVFAKITTSVDVPQKRVQDLLVGLYENGYSSWLLKMKKHDLAAGLVIADFKEGGKMTDPDEYYAPSQIIPFVEGCSTVLIVENPTTGPKTIEFTLNAESLKKGLQLMAEKRPDLFNEFMEENDDANHADCFGQFVVYGEIVYG